MHPLDYVFIGVWAAFWVYWLAAAATAKRTARRHSGRALGARLVVIVVAVAVAHSGAIGPSGPVTSPSLEAAGTALFFSGLALAVWARLCLGRNWGMPMTEKAEPELVTGGPYRRIRHPIYSGIILAMVGTTMATDWYWGFVAVLMGAYFTYSAVVEDHNMARLFPATYPEYRRRTKMLVPFVL